MLFAYVCDCFFVFVVVSDGNLLLQLRFIRQILASSYGGDDDYLLSVSDSEYVLIGVACVTLFWFGGVVSTLALRHVSVLAVQLQGFALCAAVYFTIALLKTHSTFGYSIASISVYVFSYFAVGVGAAPCVLLLPSLLFPASVKRTVHYASSISGKLGALIGLLIAGSTGVHICIRMSLFGGACMCGIAATLILVQTRMQATPSIDHHSLASSPSKQSQWHQPSSSSSSYGGLNSSPGTVTRSPSVVKTSTSPAANSAAGRSPSDNNKSDLSEWLRGEVGAANDSYRIYGSEEGSLLFSGMESDSE